MSPAAHPTGAEGGRIKNTAWILAAAKQPLAGAVGYVAGKYAVLRLTRTLAVELAPPC